MGGNRKVSRRNNVKRGKPVDQPAAANDFDYQPETGPYRERAPLPERETAEGKGRRGPNRSADAHKRGTAGE